MTVATPGKKESVACPAVWRVFLRSLTLQGSWNPQRMQNLGLVFTLIPWLRCQGASVAQIRNFCRRHYVYFNTNPYMANYLLGGLMRLETIHDDPDEVLPTNAVKFKDSLGRALASLGDQLFWLGLQPTLMLLAASLVMVGWWPAALALVAIFGILELVFRYVTLFQGYRLGLDIVELLGRPIWHRAIRWSERLGAFVAGGILALAVMPRPEVAELGRDVLSLYPLIVFVSMLLRRRLPGESILLLHLPLALLLAYL